MGVAIIDQSICSHARYFLGSYESTFTFRIQEEREIHGFPTKKTFDMLCADGKFDCEKGSQWKIEYPKKKVIRMSCEKTVLFDLYDQSKSSAFETIYCFYFTLIN